MSFEYYAPENSIFDKLLLDYKNINNKHFEELQPKIQKLKNLANSEISKLIDEFMNNPTVNSEMFNNDKNLKRWDELMLQSFQRGCKHIELKITKQLIISNTLTSGILASSLPLDYDYVDCKNGTYHLQHQDSNGKNITVVLEGAPKFVDELRKKMDPRFIIIGKDDIVRIALP